MMLARGHQNILADALVLRHSKQHSLLLKQTRHQTRVHMLQNFHNGTLWAATGIGTNGAHHDAITMQDALHFARAQKDVAAAVFTNGKTETFWMSFHAR